MHFEKPGKGEPVRPPQFQGEGPALALDERAFLEGLGLPETVLSMATARAAANGSRIEEELIAGGMIDEASLYRGMARHIGLDFLAAIDSGSILPNSALDTQLLRPLALRLVHPAGGPLTAIVPELGQLAAHRRRVADGPALRRSLAVTTPSAVRRAVWSAGGSARLARVLAELFDKRPEDSARVTLVGMQGFLAGLGLAGLAILFVSAPHVTLACCHVFLSAFFLSMLMFRMAAIRDVRRLRPGGRLQPEDRLPVYTVLVPLYHEKDIVAQLVERLSMLDWPKSRLDIKIVCEDDDAETLQALQALDPGPAIEIVRVPGGGPRTKPKALCYALAGARGDYLAVYDAEDRPHPGQLREAYSVFRSEPGELACLQAPLVVANGGETWLASLFAIEYAGLFRALLPYLSRRGLPLPLGGTSNHFRTAALIECGAWDPYNVTEDADLGLRLHRMGYRSATITRPTLEDAPTEIRPWIGQRTRWFKGWLQTWLVVMRRPLDASREMGPGGTICFHLLITGMLVSSLGHPLMIGFIAAAIWRLAETGLVLSAEAAFLAVDSFNVIGSYVVFALLGRRAMTGDERRRVGFHVLLLPAYWGLITFASWRAVAELRANPFFWQKTAHRPSRVEKR
jgi:cellulose synthase/poly-beta-1,6-N-acetylglucosamine synthase-like glycosyltransferase